MCKTFFNEVLCVRKKRLLFRIGSDAGFFSEYNNMVLTILYCKKHGIQFYLSSKDANFAYSCGWRDYFESFCREINLPHQQVMNPRYSHPFPTNGKREKIKRFVFNILKNLLRIDLLTYNVFDSARSQEVNDVLIEDCRKINQSIWKYNKSTLQAIEKRKMTISLPKEYVGLHIRRGDKSMETKHTGLQQYIDALAVHSKCRNVFVATDDYSVYEELCQKYPTWAFYTLTTPQHSGYNQRTFEKYTKAHKYDEMISLFTDIELLASSSLFVGTLSSNIGMYLYWRLPKGKCIGVDYREWRIW